MRPNHGRRPACNRCVPVTGHEPGTRPPAHAALCPLSQGSQVRAESGPSFTGRALTQYRLQLPWEELSEGARGLLGGPRPGRCGREPCRRGGPAWPWRELSVPSPAVLPGGSRQAGRLRFPRHYAQSQPRAGPRAPTGPPPGTGRLGETHRRPRPDPCLPPTELRAGLGRGGAGGCTGVPQRQRPSPPAPSRPPRRQHLLRGHPGAHRPFTPDPPVPSRP